MITWIFLTFGTIGAICFALSGAPQAWKSWREKHSEGIAWGTVVLWLVGEGATLLYALYFYPTDWILLSNYLLNTFFVSIIFIYKILPIIRKT